MSRLLKEYTESKNLPKGSRYLSYLWAGAVDVIEIRESQASAPQPHTPKLKVSTPSLKSKPEDSQFLIM